MSIMQAKNIEQNSIFGTQLYPFSINSYICKRHNKYKEQDEKNHYFILLVRLYDSRMGAAHIPGHVA
jgi:hypothetical protein